jgi:hypothetical protein
MLSPCEVEHAKKEMARLSLLIVRELDRPMEDQNFELLAALYTRLHLARQMAENK